MVVTPHLGASTAEAQDKAGQTIAEQVVLALKGEFVPFAVNSRPPKPRERCGPSCRSSSASAASSPRSPAASSTRLEMSYEGAIADYDCGS